MCERPRSHHLSLSLQRKRYLRGTARMVARVRKLARLDRQGRLSHSFKRKAQKIARRYRKGTTELQPIKPKMRWSSLIISRKPA